MSEGICGCKNCGCKTNQFQSHVTFDFSASPAVKSKIEKYMKGCGGEVIYIENHLNGGRYKYEAITSMSHSTKHEAMIFIKITKVVLEMFGLEALRSKIEASPFAQFCEPVLYSEAHYKIDERVPGLLISRAMIKNRLFGTKRVEGKADLAAFDIFPFPKTVEYVIYDDNRGLDSWWEYEQ